MKYTILSLVLAVALIGGVMYFAGKSGSTASTSNVFMENGKQIVEINAKSGYSPSLTAAKSGIPTILRMKTNGTYDCSAGLKIPSISYQTFLPASGSTDIDIPSQAAGGSINAVCVMGMYNFAVNFN